MSPAPKEQPERQAVAVGDHEDVPEILRLESEHADVPTASPAAPLRRTSSYLVPFLAFAVFSGTSCWFATNAVINQVVAELGLSMNVNVVLGYTTDIINLGFILGTLLLALTSLPDRINPRHIFFCACTCVAITNALVMYATTLTLLLTFRCCTGVCLAGVYPVAMKLAASHFQKGLGGTLGFLLGALVLGTAFPHLLDTFGNNVLPWRSTLLTVSMLAFAGALVIELFVEVGPHHKKAPRFDPCAVVHLFKDRLFRANAIGYFGHNWEVYSFWTFCPDLITIWSEHGGSSWHGSPSGALQGVNIHLLVFFVISASSVSCMGGSLLVERYGSAALAFGNLLCSCLCCLLSPLVLSFAPFWVFIPFLFIWGFAVAGDSPHFSALSARYCPPEIVASAMTIVVCVGFTFTVISLALMSWAIQVVDGRFIFALVVAPGPIVGLLFFWLVFANRRAETWDGTSPMLQASSDPSLSASGRINCDSA